MTAPVAPLSLKPLGPADAGEVQALTNRISDETGMLLQAPGERPPIGPMTALLELLSISPESGIAIGAWQEGRLAGYGMALADSGSGLSGFWHIALAVDAPARAKGLGKALIAGLAGCGRAAGAHHLLLSVRTINAPGLGLYRSAGFDRLGLLAGNLACESGGNDEWMMALALAGDAPGTLPLPALPPPVAPARALPVRRLAVLGPSLAASWHALGPDGVADTALWPTFELGDGQFLVQLQPGGMQRTRHAARLALAARTGSPPGALAGAVQSLPDLREGLRRLTLRVPTDGMMEAILAGAGWQREYVLPGGAIAGWALVA
jgi:ribosomal protein S18 acetylase RimI-like enzyme